MNPIVPLRILPLLLYAVLIATGADVAATNTVAFTTSPSKLYNRELKPLSEKDRTGWHLDARDGDGVAWWPSSQLANGAIEFEVRGRDILQKSFLGIAFHGLTETNYDAVYFRPFNFKTPDPVRHVHGVQYVAHPAFPWFKLRAEHPGQYEQEVVPAPDPNDWFHVRVEITHPTVTVFVNGSQKPSLTVKQLSDRKGGWIGLWVGNGSEGDFANLKVTPAK
ncbi:MAG TPA: hypothetical protein VMF06_17590 [Candidatus Limnocylindria bacterium]|nr:hypothetical protein [Candidatus Limnocylindria bacterium]